MNKWKKLEISLLVGLIVMIVFAGKLDYVQQDLSQKLLRLHVVANSDTDRDQEIKLKVKDRIVAETERLLQSETDLDQAQAVLQSNLLRFEAIGQEVVNAEGANYIVEASLEDNVWFPTKAYDGFSLPAGTYTALRVVIGEGEGQNWWCVLFPPLCAGVATESFEDSAQVAGLTDEQISLIVEEDEGYVFQFKCVELWETIKHYLF